MQYTISTRKYFFLGILFAAIALGLLLLAPFLTVIVLSAALSVLFYPLYRWIYKKIAHGIAWVAALLTILIFILILCIPIFLVGITVINQVQDIYTWIISNGGFDAQVAKLNTFIGGIMPFGSLNIEQYANDIVASITDRAGVFFTATLSTIFSFLLIVLTMFYFLKDGDAWKATLVDLSPLSNETNSKILEKMKNAVNGIFKGYLLIGLTQGLLMGIGLWIFGVPNPALWGSITFIASLVPTIGTALIAVPAILFLAAMGETTNMIGLAIWSLVIVGTVDNFLNPIIVGRKIAIHPLLILFAVLGGIALMGPIGILVGPLIISFLYALMSVYKTEMTP
jgi:predicted PurR-regulated permease PerM